MAPQNENGPGIVPSHDAALVQTVQRVPRLARWVLPVTAILRRGTTVTTLEPRVRSLVTLRIAAIEAAEYWLPQQRAVAADVGVSAHELHAVEDGRWHSLDSLSPRERAALRWADSVATREAKRDKETFAELHDQFSTAEIVELTALAGLCAMLDRFANALQLSPEPDRPVDVAGAVSPAELAAWADAMFAVDEPAAFQPD